MRMGTITVWHGSDKDLGRLRQACNHNCVCDAETGYTCAAHAMLSNQTLLDHLAFVGMHRRRYVAAEWLMDYLHG